MFRSSTLGSDRQTELSRRARQYGILSEELFAMKPSCPVCGYRMDEDPSDYAICPCCGTEFGYHTAARRHSDLRKEWLRSGGMWWSPVDPKPNGWNPYVQLIHAGIGVADVLAHSATNASRSTTARVRPQRALRAVLTSAA